MPSVESYIINQVLPYLANTHTTTSLTGSQSTAFVQEARQIVAEAVNARVSGKAATDVVIFAGDGATSAVDALISLLPRGGGGTGGGGAGGVVIVGPMQHHSNYVTWRESGLLVVDCPTVGGGGSDVDVPALERLLDEHGGGEGPRYTAWTAASNVTGYAPPMSEVYRACKRRGYRVFVDYASSAPYLKVDVNERGGEVDAAFVSCHKLLGGVGSSGVLVVKKDLVPQAEPPGMKRGGGTVFYVTRDSHRFLSNRVERNEGGSPNVLARVRAGMGFLVKRAVGVERIGAVDAERR